MDYQKIMCEFCKECTEFKMNIRIVKAHNTRETDTTIIKCENFQPKFNFKSSTEKCCSFFIEDEYD